MIQQDLTQSGFLRNNRYAKRNNKNDDKMAVTMRHPPANDQIAWLDEDVSTIMPKDLTQRPSLENDTCRKRLLRDKLNQNSGTNFDASVN